MIGSCMHHASCIMLHRPVGYSQADTLQTKTRLAGIDQCDISVPCVASMDQSRRIMRVQLNPGSTPPSDVVNVLVRTPLYPRSRSFMSPLAGKVQACSASPIKGYLCVRYLAMFHWSQKKNCASSSTPYVFSCFLPYMSTHLAQHPASCSPLSISMGLGGPFAPEVPPLPVE